MSDVVGEMASPPRDAVEPRAVRVGVDGRVFEGVRTGVGRYAYELCAALDDVVPGHVEFVVYARRPVELPRRSNRWRLRVEPRRAFARLPASVWLKTRAPLLLRDDRLDVFWGTAALLPPLPDRTRAVVTVYDLNHRVAANTIPWATRLMHAAFFDADVRRADGVVAISRGTADRLARLAGVRADAVARPAAGRGFTPPPPDVADAVLARLGVVRPYFVAVGTREPRKNLPLLVRAFREQLAAGALAGHTLVLTGARGWRERALAREVALAPRQSVALLGYVPDEALPALYARAAAFVFPSRYEGFGIPALEARACGAVMICADVPEIREAGGADACYVVPTAAALGAALAAAGRGELRRSNADVDGDGWGAAARETARVLLGAVSRP